MPTIPYETRQKIVAQALIEVQFDRQYKQGKIGFWKINEDLYYGRKPQSIDSRANVDLGQMSSFVHTILSKVDNPLTFKFTKRKDAQLKRVQMLNALKVIDQQADDWDIKDIVGKKQAIIYGRAIFSYFADSPDGKYAPHLDNVDVYDFLIDPSAGGIDIERAMHLGRYGVVKTRKQIKDGVKAKIYLKTEADELLAGGGNSTESTQEETNKKNRIMDTNVYTTTKEIDNPDKFKFWEWYTTFEGERYYLLLTETGGTAIRIEKLVDMFESDMWPFWTWAVFPDLTEFWTPSFCDYVREIFMAQAVSINQMLDNAEQINKPQTVVQVGAIEDLAQLKYRREGRILVKKDIDASKAIQRLVTPSISTPIEVFKLLDAIQEKASGVTGAAKGVSDQDKVGINDADLAASADRFGYLNKSYSFGTKRFAKLYEHGVRENLVRKTAVDILGPNGVEIIEVSRRDIFRKKEDFGIMVDSSNAEIALSEVDKKAKLAFLSANSQNPVQNPKKAYELSATIAGFDDDTIRQLQDTSEFGTAAIMAEAERDIEGLLDGEDVKPNQGANTAYKQRFVDYMQNNQDKITMDQFNRLTAYIALIDPIIVRNMVRQANELLMKAQMKQLSQTTPDGGPPDDAVKDVNVTKTFADTTPAPEELDPTLAPVGA